MKAKSGALNQNVQGISHSSGFLPTSGVLCGLFNAELSDNVRLELDNDDINNNNTVSLHSSFQKLLLTRGKSIQNTFFLFHIVLYKIPEQYGRFIIQD